MLKQSFKKTNKKSLLAKTLLAVLIFTLATVGIIAKHSQATPATSAASPAAKSTVKVQSASINKTGDNSARVKSASTENTAESTPKTVQPAAAPTLLFSDDFSGSAVDSGKWTSCFPGNWAGQLYTNCTHEENKELQCYTTSNVSMSGGVLYLTAKQESKDCQGKTYAYTSGLIQTYGKFSFTYGYVEARAKTPLGQGFWPTIWTLPSSSLSWPPELDMLEQYGNQPTMNSMTVHYGANGDYSDPYAQKKFYGADYTAAFHTYGMDWQKGYVNFYIDGQLVYAYANDNVPSQAMYLLLNLAVGGTGGGAVGADTVFPSSLQIDYIKVWNQKP